MIQGNGVARAMGKSLAKKKGMGQGQDKTEIDHRCQ